MKTSLCIVLSSVIFLLCVSGCKTTKPDDAQKVSDYRTEAYTEDGQPAEVKQKRPDASQDLNAFLSELRKAVAKKDMETIASVMTSNFGYQLNPIVKEGAGVFQYWDERDLWNELKLIVDGNFAPLGDYYVAPEEFAIDPSAYSGYRAGVIKTTQGWKFAYFVTN